VTVRVTISRTCRTLGLQIRGDLTSKCLPLLLLLKSQSNERALKGDRTADVADALIGDSIEYAGEGGIRRRPARSVFGSGAEVGRITGVGGFSTVGDVDLWVSQLQEQLLCSLDAVEGAVEGADVGVDLPDSLSVPPDKGGLAIDIDLRKSV